jgi:hypothetical protein
MQPTSDGSPSTPCAYFKFKITSQWELIEGPDLLELLNESGRRMNEPMAAFFFVQLLRAVSCAVLCAQRAGDNTSH